MPGLPSARRQGAIGAGAFPALAHNAKLKAAVYPIYIILNGHGGMPWFGAAPADGGLTDAQIAAVVAYIRTNFGNTHGAPVKPADVAGLRGPTPVLEQY